MRYKRIFATAALAIGTSFIASTITPNAFAGVDVGIVVGTAPPAPRVVVRGPVGVAPGPGYVWSNGFWDWNGGAWVWVDGRWLLPPRGRRVWVEPVYRPYRGSFRYYRGYWR